MVYIHDFSLILFQVTELSPEETESVTGGYGKSISHVIIGLKTVKGTKQLKLDPTIYDALIKEKVISSNISDLLKKNYLLFWLSSHERALMFALSVLRFLQSPTLMLFTIFS